MACPRTFFPICFAMLNGDESEEKEKNESQKMMSTQDWQNIKCHELLVSDFKANKVS